MNKIKLLSLALIALFCFSCKPDKTDYTKLIQGEWFCQDINSLTIPTNDVFVMSFQENGTGSLKQRYTLPDSGGTQWIESSLYFYTVNEDGAVSMQGTNPLGESVNIAFSIKKITSSILEYRESSHIINGQETTMGQRFWLEKSKESCFANIQGTWDGRQVFKVTYKDSTLHVFVHDSISEPYCRYQFYADSTFDYYKIVDGAWEKAEDIKGIYRVNGHLLSLNQEIISTSKSSCDCWIIESVTDKKVNCRQWQRRFWNSKDLDGIRLWLERE